MSTAVLEKDEDTASLVTVTASAKSTPPPARDTDISADQHHQQHHHRAAAKLTDISADQHHQHHHHRAAAKLTTLQTASSPEFFEGESRYRSIIHSVPAHSSHTDTCTHVREDTADACNSCCVTPSIALSLSAESDGLGVVSSSSVHVRSSQHQSMLSQQTSDYRSLVVCAVSPYLLSDIALLVAAYAGAFPVRPLHTFTICGWFFFFPFSFSLLLLHCIGFFFFFFLHFCSHSVRERDRRIERWVDASMLSKMLNYMLMTLYFFVCLSPQAIAV